MTTRYRSRCPCLCHLPECKTLHVVACCQNDPDGLPPPSEAERLALAEERVRRLLEIVKMLGEMTMRKKAAV